jgi:hypothetical protein
MQLAQQCADFSSTDAVYTYAYVLPILVNPEKNNQKRFHYNAADYSLLLFDENHTQYKMQ